MGAASDRPVHETGRLSSSVAGGVFQPITGQGEVTLLVLINLGVEPLMIYRYNIIVLLSPSLTP